MHRGVGPLTPKTVSSILVSAAHRGAQQQLDKTKRVSSASNPSAQTVANAGASVPLVQRLQWMIVPEFLSEELWTRHGYSLSDIRKTLDAFPPRVIWQLVRSYNCPATNASSRIYCETDTLPTYGSKSTAVQKLLTILKDRHPDWSKRPSITWNMSKMDDANGDGRFYEAYDRHLPGLPVHRVPNRAFEVLVANLATAPALSAAPPPSSSLTVGQFQKSVRAIFAWRGILAVALELNAGADMLLLGRVIPWRSYVQAFGLPRALRSCPNVVVAADGYYALMNEQFYFYCPDSPVASSIATSLASSATKDPASSAAPIDSATATGSERPPKRAHTARHS
jgi:hypothetical protein